jgi:WD40 repeat protein
MINNLSPLSPDNIHRLKPLAHLGRGRIDAIAWLDTDTLAVVTESALWHYTRDGQDRQVIRFQHKIGRFSKSLWLSDDHTRLAIWDGDKTFHLYDTHTGSAFPSIIVPGIESPLHLAVTLTHDHLTVNTRIYDISSGAPLPDIVTPPPPELRYEAVFLHHQIQGSPAVIEGRHLTAHVDKTLIQLSNGLVFDAHPGLISTLVFIDGDSIIISGDQSGVVLVWNTATGEILNRREDYLNFVRLNAGQTTIAAVTANNDVVLWNWRTDDTHTFPHGGARGSSELCFHPHGLTSFSHGERKVCLWSLPTQTLTTIQPVQNLSAAISDNILAWQAGDQVIVRDLISGETLFTRPGGFPIMFHRHLLLIGDDDDAFSPSNGSPDTAIIVINDTGHLFTVDLDTGQESLFLSLSHHEFVRVSPTTPHYLRQIAPQAFGLFDFDTHHLLHTIYPAHEQLRWTAFGIRHLLTLSHINRESFALEIWDIETGSLISRGDLPDGDIAIFSPDDRWVMIECHHAVYVWNVEENRLQGQMRIRIQSTYIIISRILFSPDSTLMASFYQTHNIIELWDTRTMNHLTTITTHTRQVDSIAFNPEGTLLAVGNNDGTITLWGVEHDQP